MINAKVAGLRTGLKILRASGLTAMLRPRLQGIGSIFCLHQVCPGGGHETGFAPNSKLEVTPQFLRGLIALVRDRGYETVSLATLVDHLKNEIVPSRPLAVFTLDDAYRDNLIFAKPVFEELACPYAIFVASAIADGQYTMWWRVLEEVVANTDHLRASIANREFDLPCRSVKEKYKAYRALFEFCAGLDQFVQGGHVDALARAFNIDPKSYCKTAAMNWDELRQIAKDPLCTVGTHTDNHYAVAKLDANQSLNEMQQSKARIEKELGRKVEFLAYPYGDRPAADKRDFALAEKAGFRASLTTRKGVIFPSDRQHLQSLPRIMISGRYQELGLVDALISGLPTALLNKFQPIHEA